MILSHLQRFVQLHLLARSVLAARLAELLLVLGRPLPDLVRVTGNHQVEPVHPIIKPKTTKMYDAQNNYWEAISVTEK